MDVSQYLEIFTEETKEHLQTLNEQLLVLEKEPDNSETINEIFRAAHSLKGMAGTMGYKRMQRLTHDMENVFSEVRSGKMTVSAELIDIVFQCIDALEEYLDNIVNNSDEGTNDNEPIIQRLNVILNGDNAPAEAPAAKETAAPAAAEAPASSDAATGDEKFRNYKLADFESKAAREAVKKGLHLYGITVYIEESCILKSARVFLIFKNLEPLGDIIRSVPSVQDIEDERFEFDFTMYLISGKSLDTIKSTIMNVSEIKSVAIKEINVEDYATDAPNGENAGTESTEVAASSAKAAKTPAKKAETAAAANKPATASGGGKPVVNRSVRVDIEKLDVLMNLVSELIIAKNGIVSASDAETGSTTQAVREQVEYLENITTNLHESVMKVRMVPIENVVNRFPRMIRDLSKKLDKKMELYMSGEDTELDRTVIDEIGDPLMHILRNSADHGLENAAVRAERGKPEVGSIFLDAYQDGNNVVIEVRDDGNGIDIEKVKMKAVEKGVITQEQSDLMDDNEAIALLFRPSFSTAEKISDVSGRGVGLDVVKTKIEGLGGNIEVKTELGVGSTFIIRLPLTLAIIQSLMVVVGGEKYAIPLSAIQTIEDIAKTDIKHVREKEVINLRGEVIPIIRLSEVLDIESTNTSDNLVVVIVKKGDKQAGLVVDELIGQLEIVIKSLGKYINNCKQISGATILGDGEVALILDANALL